jgi:hypothetical protein
MSEKISRRRACSLLGLTAALAFAAPATVLTVSDAEAQTAGWCGVKSGVELAGPGVRRGVPCGVARHHSRSGCPAAISAKP